MVQGTHGTPTGIRAVHEEHACLPSQSRPCLFPPLPSFPSNVSRYNRSPPPPLHSSWWRGSSTTLQVRRWRRYGAPRTTATAAATWRRCSRSTRTWAGILRSSTRWAFKRSPARRSWFAVVFRLKIGNHALFSLSVSPPSGPFASGGARRRGVDCPWAFITEQRDFGEFCWVFKVVGR